MKFFVDANILVYVVKHQYPEFEICSRLLSLQGNQNFEVFTSPLCLAIAFYFAEKKSGSKEAFKKIKILADRLSITHCGSQETRLAAGLKSCTDFEDALQYQSAIGSGCKAIVTYDSQDFYFSNIPVLEPMEFFRQFVFDLKK